MNKDKLQELIDKYTERDTQEAMIEAWDILKDLQSLQEQEETLKQVSVEELINDVELILLWIDKQETEEEYWWRETSQGAEFWKDKLLCIKNYIKTHFIKHLTKETKQEEEANKIVQEDIVEIRWLSWNFPYLCKCWQECRDGNWHIFNYCSYCWKKIKWIA